MNSIKVSHYDVATIEKGAFKTAEGYIKADTIVTRTGVFRYRNADGSIRRELRHPDDVFDSESLESLKMIPLTDGHPPVMVNADNASMYQVGHVGENVRAEDGNLYAPLLVTHSDAVKSVEDGSREELSCGYEAVLVPESGVYEGERYDFRQTAIRYNHLALVDQARAGSMARINLDSLAVDGVELVSDGKPVTHPPSDNNPGGSRMLVKKRIDGIDYECAPEIANALDRALEAGKKSSEKVDSLTGEIEKLRADRDSKAEELKKVTDGLDARIEKAVNDRMDLYVKANKLLPADTKIDGMSDIEIMTAAISAANPEAKLDGASDEYVKARFDICVENADQSNLGDAREKLYDPPNPEKKTDSISARKAMLDRLSKTEEK